VKIQAIIFDLDDTLINTTKIFHFRSRGNWRRCYENFHQTKCNFDLEFFTFLKKHNIKVGIVTMSPRLYARQLLSYHNISYDSLVAYHDCTLKKPNPEPMIICAKELEIAPYKILAVGDSGIDIEAANRAFMMSIAVPWGEATSNQLENFNPNKIIQSSKDLKEIIQDSITNDTETNYSMLLNCTEMKHLVIDSKYLINYINTKEFREALCSVKARGVQLHLVHECKQELDFVQKKGDFSYVQGNCLTEENILSVLYEIKASINEVVLLTADPSIIKVAQENYITVIFFNENKPNPNVFPDQAANKLENLQMIFKNNMYGFFNEIIAQGERGNGWIHSFQPQHELDSRVRPIVYTGGRYFPTKDIRSSIHCLSKKIVDIKNNHNYIDDSIPRMINENLKIVELKEGVIDLITCVPSRNNKQPWLEKVLTTMKIGEKYLPLINTQVLKVTRNYPKQAYINWRDRFNNVSNAFECNIKIKGHIVLLDDIYTRGATVLECARVLYQNGAEKVTVIVLGVTQQAISGSFIKSSCSVCNSNMNLVIGDSLPVWRCMNPLGCSHELSYLKGKNIAFRKKQNYSLNIKGV
jgi:phosphoglycolate phosphatase-like HAD superfamily hydrolase